MTATVTVSPANLITTGEEFYKRYPRQSFCQFSKTIQDRWIVNFNLINKTIAAPKNARMHGESWKEWIESLRPYFEELIAWRLWDGDMDDMTMDFWEIEIDHESRRLSDPPGWVVWDFTVKDEYMVTPGNGELVKVP
jgi:hypothetical protein